MTLKRNNSAMRIYPDKDGDFCRIELTRGKYAKVDPSDYQWLSAYKWQTNYFKHNGRCVAVASIGSKKVKMHRLILGLVNGACIDHRNHNPLDNRRSNLRVATNQQNQHNQRVRGKGSSRYKGVCWHRRYKKWQAELRYNRKMIYLGQFDNEIEAARAYDEGAKKYYGGFACLNFP